jgi:hypothetical protein
MTKNAILFVTLCGGLLALARCSHVNRTITSVKPDYQKVLQTTRALASLPRSYAFCQGDFIDKRAETPLGVYRRELVTNIVETRDDLQGVLFRGLEALMTGAGQRWTDKASAELRLNVRLLSTMAEIAADFGSHYSTAVQIQLDVVATRTQRSSTAGRTKDPRCTGIRSMPRSTTRSSAASPPWGTTHTWSMPSGRPSIRRPR